MHLDVLQLREFYYRSALGRTAQRLLREQVAEFWPNVGSETVVGFGFAVPLLRPYLNTARRVIGLMPGQQGVMHWPAHLPNHSALCDETRWPLATGTVDRLIVLHGLETSDDMSALLDECWRVLGPGGRALFIVPNRAGLWARRDGTPFGYGRPYTLGQLEQQLTNHHFAPGKHRAGLFMPPSRKRFWLQSAAVAESVGRKISSHWAGGVLMVEATKHAFLPKNGGTAERVSRPLRVLEGLTSPEAKPAFRSNIQN